MFATYIVRSREGESRASDKECLISRLRIGGNTHEHFLHRINAREVTCHILITTAFTWDQTKPALCEGFGSSGATQMNDLSKLLRMLRGKLGSGGEEARKITVQINRRELDRVARQHPSV